jgi:hypothetical protein
MFINLIKFFKITIFLYVVLVVIQYLSFRFAKSDIILVHYLFSTDIVKQF